MTKFHLIGIGGAGMSVVAQLLHDAGAEVSGSDQSDSAILRQLQEQGISVYSSHDAAQVPEDAVVVVSTAIRDNNPELAQARRRGQRVIHRSQALALAATGMRFVAVAGAHGKTTTSGMLSVLLSQAKLDPSFAVGSIVKGYNSGAHLGSGDIFVAEADESDGSFLNYSPTVEIVTSVEPDHLDFYGTFEQVKTAFANFAENLVSEGVLVAFADNPGSAELAAQTRASRRVVTYGQSDSADVKIRECADTGLGQAVKIQSAQGQYTLNLAVGGIHNARNATAAWAAACELGVDPQTAAESLSAFTGTARRFDPRGEACGVRIFDDYAHHPTEVAMAVAQARKVAGEGRVIVAFQPHLYSRTLSFAQEFADALDGADLAFVSDIYRAREDERDDVDATTITTLAQRAVPSGSLADTAEQVAEQARLGDVVLTMGAGDITTAGPQILKLLKAREAQSGGMK
ncbi:UDP-N-acetylmuramate--L-alanine ligase [Boudabousia marimammalium]|uniref:UDP-N-acetylmuramate--L-alanine ligase n=1 Tax=Boudabousia marimammalium TaxID=156892 RepID=A0A1Q5PNU2_9ACTO|nr:UDP-N-acetylmuramate--L-alanine ligase [Boudabousia marimammalium]OKL49241.1 UDP-N-acetylmuramate--L-alanine ligase [Boudabousia marimammalium]